MAHPVFLGFKISATSDALWAGEDQRIGDRAAAFEVAFVRIGIAGLGQNCPRFSAVQRDSVFGSHLLQHLSQLFKREIPSGVFVRPHENGIAIAFDGEGDAVAAFELIETFDFGRDLNFSIFQKARTGEKTMRNGMIRPIRGQRPAGPDERADLK